MKLLESDTGTIYVKRHDAQAGLTLKPLGSRLRCGPGLERSSSVVYPTSNGAAVVLSPRANGVKEDMGSTASECQ